MTSLVYSKYGPGGNDSSLLDPNVLIIPLTSGLVKYPLGAFIAESVSNTVLLDTIGTAFTQIGFLTIPGGAMGLRSRIVFHASLSGTGGNTKDVSMRAGPVSGTFATASGFGGQSGLTNQLFFPQSPMIWNNGTLGAQRGTPGNLPNWFAQGNNSTPLATFTIDTSLDWNLYVGVKFGLASGGDSMTLNQMFAQILN